MMSVRRTILWLGMLGAIIASSTASVAQPSVTASEFGIAIGGSVTGSTVTIGIAPSEVQELVQGRTRPLEDLTAQQRMTIGLLQEKLELNERQIRAALDIVGEASVPPERLAAKLVEIARQFAALRDIAASNSGESAEIKALKENAQSAIADGDLAAADALLARVETLQEDALREPLRQHARTKAQRGEIALARLRYVDAATLFGQAAQLLDGDTASFDDYISYLTQEAQALQQNGAEFGDKASAAEAVAKFRVLVELWEDGSSHDRAMAEIALAQALYSLYFRSADVAVLDEAIVRYQSAAARLDRQSAPLDWAMAQGQLGISLSARALVPGRPDAAEESIAALEAALSVDEVDAATRATFKIGVAQLIAGRATDVASKQRAVDEVREALALFPKEDDPIAWGRAQAFLASTLFGLSISANDSALMEESADHFVDALAVIPEERFPMEWAILQGSFGIVLMNLGYVTSDASYLEQATDAYRAALLILTPDRSPVEWIMAQQNLADVLVALGEQKADARLLEEAISIYSAAMPVKTRVPELQWLQLEQKVAFARALLDRVNGAPDAGGQ